MKLSVVSTAMAYMYILNEGQYDLIYTLVNLACNAVLL